MQRSFAQHHRTFIRLLAATLLPTWWLVTSCTQRTAPGPRAHETAAAEPPSTAPAANDSRVGTRAKAESAVPELTERQEAGEIAESRSAANKSAESGAAESQASVARAAPPSPAKPSAGGLGLQGIGSGSGSAKLRVAGKSWGGGRLGGSHFAPGVASPPFNTENYQHLPESTFRAVRADPLSTFSVDVDTASYSNARRFLTTNTQPPEGSVRVEEFINYFSYDDALPADGKAIALTSEVSACPWEPTHRLVRLALRTPKVTQGSPQRRNLVFLLDVSGSMQSPDKLPLLKQGMALLTETLRPSDKISIVVYAGAAGLVLPPTAGNRRGAIHAAIAALEAGGSTNGGEGIELAYRTARAEFIPGGVNRVILATDGDFNVGVSSDAALVQLVEEKRKSGVFLTVLGFGTGNLKDSRMESLADKGNGNYAYIDSVAEARKVLVRQGGSTLETVAKDVKLQVEWNPARVKEYRLIGYENRLLAKEDFNDDTKDAGEMGQGHTVTALYEFLPIGSGKTQAGSVDPLKYQGAPALSPAASLPELLTVKVRYKAPSSNESRLETRVVHDNGKALDEASQDFRFSAAVANFALLLKQSKLAGKSSFGSVRTLAAGALGADPHGERAEFLTLVGAAQALGQARPKPNDDEEVGL